MILKNYCSGWFDLRVCDANTGRVTKQRSFPNLITNDGLKRYCSGNDFSSVRVCVGTGTAEPRPEDTGLSNFLCSTWQTGSIAYNWSTPQAPDYLSTTGTTLRFEAGKFKGDAISEIGICRSGSVDVNNPLWCRSLILDDNGNPSAITILPNEYLDVTYKLIYHPDLTDTRFSFNMDGVVYNCVARVANVNTGVFNNSGGGHALTRGPLAIHAVYNTQQLGEITGEPIYNSGGKLNTIYVNNHVDYYSANPYSHTTNYTLELSKGNFDGGIGAMLFGTNHYYANGIMNFTQVSFEPKIPKDSNTEITFTLSKTISRWPHM